MNHPLFYVPCWKVFEEMSGGILLEGLEARKGFFMGLLQAFCEACSGALLSFA